MEVAPCGCEAVPVVFVDATGTRREIKPCIVPCRPLGDSPIYTHHRILRFWHQGRELGYVEEGVSVKGRPLLDIEIEDVDSRVRKLAYLNEKGELAK